MFRELLRTVSVPIIISMMMKTEMMVLEIVVYLQFSHPENILFNLSEVG